MPIVIKKRILSWILPKLLAKKAPSIVTIASTDKEEEGNNCYTIHLTEKGSTEPTHVVDGFNKEKKEINTRRIDDKGKYSIEENLSLDDALSHKVSVTHYYHGALIDYDNLYKIAFNCMIPYQKFKFKFVKFWNSVIQKKLIIKDSFELLRFLLDRQIKKTASSPYWKSAENQGVDILVLMRELYSQRWIEHPDSKTEQARLELHLNSLIESGDLEFSSGKYIVKGKAIKTLETYEENERRHKDDVKLRRLIVLLTGIIAFAAIVDAGIVDVDSVLRYFWFR